MAKKQEKNKDDNNGRRSAGQPAATIVPADLVKEMRDSYLDYAMSVIVARALPDVRDGLKPVHRRILYSMHQMGLTASAKFRKSAAIVGDVIAKYHPHGDAAVYDSLVKMTQTFSIRYPLILGQGNFGSVDGDAPAAYRYTEAKMSRLAAEVMRDIEKETVDWTSSYDATRKEPLHLPSAVPLILLNGTLGIAVGMATKIPPHNLREVMEALIYLVDHPEASTEELLGIVAGPDFPTGGLVFNIADIHHLYSTGRGGLVVRGEAEIVEENGQYKIIISSIPYQINKAEFIAKIADLVQLKKLEGIRDIRDESTTDVRIVIELKSGAFPEKILNSLYKHTELETTFHSNFLALVGGVPQTLSLKVMLEEFLSHRQEVVRRRSRFELVEAEAREHILLGLSKALDHIDEVIKTIKKAKDVSSAHRELVAKFRFSDLQATAILEMKLAKLAGLERQKIEEELKAKQILIKELKAILASPKKVLEIIKKESREIIEKYADLRRTKIIKRGAKIFSAEDLIPDTESVLVLTQGGYIKRTDPAEYRKQRRGGVGVMDLDTKEEDFIKIILTASNHSDLLFFTDRGKVYQLKMYEIPEGRRATRGKSIHNFLALADAEKISSVLALPKTVKEKSGLILMMVTRLGQVKKVSAETFRDVRRSGIIALKLAKGDELLSAFLVEKGETLILATRGGQAVRFKESDVRQMGRAAGGVRGIRLAKSDQVIGADRVGREDTKAILLVMSSAGFGKATLVSQYKIQKRGGSGIKTAKVTAKTGSLVVARVLTEEEEIAAISKNGQVIRIEKKEVPILGRQTQGVRIMKLRAGDSLASMTFL